MVNHAECMVAKTTHNEDKVKVRGLRFWEKQVSRYRRECCRAVDEAVPNLNTLQHVCLCGVIAQELNKGPAMSVKKTLKKMEMDFKPMEESDRCLHAANSQLMLANGTGLANEVAWVGRPKPFTTFDEILAHAGGFQGITDEDFMLHKKIDMDSEGLKKLLAQSSARRGRGARVVPAKGDKKDKKRGRRESDSDSDSQSEERESAAKQPTPKFRNNKSMQCCVQCLPDRKKAKLPLSAFECLWIYPVAWSEEKGVSTY